MSSRIQNRFDAHGVTYRRAVEADVATLPAVAQQIFTETFASRFSAAEFSQFCDTAYGPSGTMVRDLRDPRIQWQIAEMAGEPIGYAKVSPLRAPALDPKPGALELQQIYVLSEWHGRGVAAVLMDWAIELARRCKVPELYLTVFDHNERAKCFYRKYGFREVGRCTFVLGGRDYDDRVWKKVM